MSDSDNLILQAIMDIKGDIGALKASSQGIEASFAQHVLDDRLLGGRIGKIETTLAKQRGASRVWVLVGTAAGGVAGTLATIYAKLHS